MNFRIKRTPPPPSDKRDERNLMWIVGTCILLWGISVNSLTKTFEPLNESNSIRQRGSLLENPYVDDHKLYLSKKLKISLKRFDKLDSKRVIAELEKGDVIWYRALLPNGIFARLFFRDPELVAFGTNDTTYLSEKDYNNSVNELAKGEKRVALLTFLLPFLVFLVRYGYLDRTNNEYGLHFTKYEG